MEGISRQKVKKLSCPKEKLMDVGSVTLKTRVHSQLLMQSYRSHDVEHQFYPRNTSLVTGVPGEGSFLRAEI